MEKFPFFLTWLFLLPAMSFAESNLSGPYPATVISVVDGDTVRVKVKIWLGLYQEVKVRIAEIDAPEISSKAKCTKEKELGLKAKEFLESVIPQQSTINLTRISEDEFGGRVDATIQTNDGKDVGELLLREGLASPYNKRGKKKNWCAPEPESHEEQVSQSKPRRDVEVDSQ
jgi:micrococcal nuclease